MSSSYGRLRIAANRPAGGSRRKRRRQSGDRLDPTPKMQRVQAGRFLGFGAGQCVGRVTPRCYRLASGCLGIQLRAPGCDGNGFQIQHRSERWSCRGGSYLPLLLGEDRGEDVSPRRRAGPPGLTHQEMGLAGCRLIRTARCSRMPEGKRTTRVSAPGPKDYAVA